MKQQHYDFFCGMTGATTLALAPQSFGDIVAVNAASAFAASLAQDISGYLAGLPSTDESNLLDLLAPPVMTADFFQFAKADDLAYLTEADDSDIRAVGANFKRISASGTIVTDATVQKGLTQRVDHRTIPMINGSRVAGWENNTAAGLKNRLIRAEKVRALAVLDAAAANTGVNWTTNPHTANPDGDIRKAAERGRIATGLPSTHVMLGSTAQQTRQDAYEAGARTNNGNHGDYTPQQVANYAQCRTGFIENGIKQAKKGATKVVTLGNVVYTYSAEKSPMVQDPSNIKRCWSPTLNGGMWMVFIQESAAWTDITVFHQSKVIIPISAGIEKLTIS
jgi:hypothetical protein